MPRKVFLYTLFTKLGVNTLHDGHGDFDILLKVDGADYDL